MASPGPQDEQATVAPLAITTSVPRNLPSGHSVPSVVPMTALVMAYPGRRTVQLSGDVAATVPLGVERPTGHGVQSPFATDALKVPLAHCGVGDGVDVA
jgi:hypothetical protein